MRDNLRPVPRIALRTFDVAPGLHAALIRVERHPTDPVVTDDGQFGLAEIHAAHMTPAQLHEVCSLIGSSDLLWAAVYTDSRLLPAAQQEDFRRRQVEKADEGSPAPAASRTTTNASQRLYAPATGFTTRPRRSRRVPRVPHALSASDRRHRRRFAARLPQHAVGCRLLGAPLRV